MKMSLGDIPVFAVLRGTMGMLTARQKVLAENIANSDTPGFTPRDVDPDSFKNLLDAARSGKKTAAITLRTSDPRHIASSRATGSAMAASVKMIKSPDSETTLNGNSVVLEEQVAELADTRMRYEMAVGLYQKSVSLLRLAIKTPGR